MIVNCEELPLFPLHVVLFPDMPLPLHIFEPRYRKMIRHCLGANQPFGVVLIQGGTEGTAEAMPHPIGTTARITKYEELADGRLNVVVVGESRFRIIEIFNNQPYLTARVDLIAEQTDDAAQSLEEASGLFKRYLRSLFALTNRRLSALQLPQEPEKLSYAIASAMQVPLSEKQRLLEMRSTQTRFEREIEVLGREIDAQEGLRPKDGKSTHDDSVIQPVNTRELMLFTSRN